jgi:hypothetical protein
MSRFRTQLRRRELVAEQTMAFSFERPSGFQFKAGQTLDLTSSIRQRLTPKGTRAHSRSRVRRTTQTSSSRPGYGTARSSGCSLRPRLPRPLKPTGRWDRSRSTTNVTKPAIFLAGGIGITPFRSMIRDAVARNLAQQLWLFYSNHRPEDAAFLEDLQTLASNTPSFYFVPTMTKMASSKASWHGQTGVINSELMNRHLLNVTAPCTTSRVHPPWSRRCTGCSWPLASTRMTCDPKSLPAIKAVNAPTGGLWSFPRQQSRTARSTSTSEPFHRLFTLERWIQPSVVTLGR